MVQVAGVDGGAVLDKEGGDLYGGGEVEWGLPVSTFCVDHLRILRDQFCELGQVTQARGRVGVELGTALEEKVHEAGFAVVEEGEAAGPPLGSLQDVGTCLEQQIDGGAIIALDGGEQGMLTEAVVGQGIVEGGTELGITIEQLANAGWVHVADRGGQHFGGGEAMGFDMLFQLRPGGETVVIGQGVLGLSQIGVLVRSGSLWLAF